MTLLNFSPRFLPIQKEQKVRMPARLKYNEGGSAQNGGTYELKEGQKNLKI